MSEPSSPMWFVSELFYHLAQAQVLLEELEGLHHLAVYSKASCEATRPHKKEKCWH